MKMGAGGTLFIGEKGKILNDVIVPKKLRDSYQRPAPSIPSSPGHEMEWILAAKGGQPAGSNFEWAGPLTETVLLGNIPLRRELRDLLNGQVLSFDPVGLTVSLPEANKFIHNVYREGWTL
jgi:hypothetical protein